MKLQGHNTLQSNIAHMLLQENYLYPNNPHCIEMTTNYKIHWIEVAHNILAWYMSSKRWQCYCHHPMCLLNIDDLRTYNFLMILLGNSTLELCIGYTLWQY